MDRKQLLEKIIAREAAMFIAVKASEPADCQEMLKTFYLMREMSHSVLAADTLTSDRKICPYGKFDTIVK
mgnify:CR=1 FL=1